MNNSESWKKSYAKAKEFIEKQQWKDSTYYLINALARMPGHIEMINDYVFIIREIVKKYQQNSELAEALQQLEWLEVFLHERIAYVEPEDLDSLLGLLTSIERQKISFLTEIEEPEKQDDDLNKEWEWHEFILIKTKSRVEEF